MLRLIPLLSSAALIGVIPRPALASLTDKLSEYTLARQAIEGLGSTRVEASQSLYLLDGLIKSKSTGHKTYDRSLHSVSRAASRIPFQSGLSGKLAVETQHSYRKQEGAELPRRIIESKKQETQLRAELALNSALGVSPLIGFQSFIFPTYTQAFRSDGLTGDDRYAPFQKIRNYFAVIRQQGSLSAGVLYETVLDEARQVERSNSFEESVISFEDQVYYPARLNFFARTELALGSLYAELSLIEASGGGARNSAANTLLEDSFRLQLGWSLPLGGKENLLDNTLVYQAMSYADRQGVSFETMPMAAFHSKLRWEAGLPLFAGVSILRGHDTQSFAEFNADYKLWGLGAEVGTLWNF